MFETPPKLNLIKDRVLLSFCDNNSIYQCIRLIWFVKFLEISEKTFFPEIFVSAFAGLFLLLSQNSIWRKTGRRIN